MEPDRPSFEGLFYAREVSNVHIKRPSCTGPSAGNDFIANLVSKNTSGIKVPLKTLLFAFQPDLAAAGRWGLGKTFEDCRG